MEAQNDQLLKDCAPYVKFAKMDELLSLMGVIACPARRNQPHQNDGPQREHEPAQTEGEDVDQIAEQYVVHKCLEFQCNSPQPTTQ